MRQAEIARRAWVLLCHDCGVTWAYANAAVEAGMVDAEDLRGHGPRGAKRWYLA